MTKRLILRLAKIALAQGNRRLPVEVRRRGPRTFSDAQWFALLVIRRLAGLDYRTVAERAERWPELGDLLGLRKKPKWTGLRDAHERLLLAARDGWPRYESGEWMDLDELVAEVGNLDRVPVRLPDPPTPRPLAPRVKPGPKAGGRRWIEFGVRGQAATLHEAILWEAQVPPKGAVVQCRGVRYVVIERRRFTEATDSISRQSGKRRGRDRRRPRVLLSLGAPTNAPVALDL